MGLHRGSSTPRRERNSAKFARKDETPLVALLAPDGKTAAYVVSNRKSTSHYSLDEIKDPARIDADVPAGVAVEPYGTRGHSDGSYAFGGNRPRWPDSSTPRRGRRSPACGRPPRPAQDRAHLAPLVRRVQPGRVAIGRRLRGRGDRLHLGLKRGGFEAATLKGAAGKTIGLAFDEAGRLLSATPGADAVVWDVASARPVLSSPIASTAEVVGFDANGTAMAVATDDHAVALWTLTPKVTQGVLRRHAGPVVALALAPGGRKVVTAGDSTVRVWEPGLRADPSLVLKGHEGPVGSLEYDPTGKHLLTGSDDGTARLWDAEAGGEIRVIGRDAGLGKVRAARFGPDGDRIVTASSGKGGKVSAKGADPSAVHVWGARDGADLLSLPDHREGARDARISRDGARLLTVSDGSTTIALTGSGANLKVERSDSGSEGLMRMSGCEDRRPDRDPAGQRLEGARAGSQPRRPPRGRRDRVRTGPPPLRRLHRAEIAPSRGTGPPPRRRPSAPTAASS